ncbi:TPA: hypothetical protein JG829_002412 [Enterobacter hormaechei subsp. steigerwaltii]|nr:hypothetical protein [Enterobacter hormaechei subsp. steigerwaltii]
MTVERMKRPWNVVGAGFNDDGVYFTFDDTTIHRADVRLMEAAPDLLEALLSIVNMDYQPTDDESDKVYLKARAAISKALGED